MKFIKFKIILLITGVIAIQDNLFSQTKVYYTSFSENFEHNGQIPLGWTQQYVSGTAQWRYENGGFTTSPGSPLSRKPMHAHGGSYNALFELQSLDNQATKLITPEITGMKDFGIHPVLKFWHSQGSWNGRTDELKVYFKAGKDSAWVLLNTYTDPIETPDSVYWVERQIPLPVNRLSNSYFIAFEGITKWGWGVCIDDVKIEETGNLTKRLKSVTCSQPVLSPIPISTNYNQILRYDLKVAGNTGSVQLKSLTVKASNTNNNDIKNNGVRLFFTTDSLFSADVQLDSANFIGDTAVFNNLNYELPFGLSFLWVTYDIKSSAVPGHYVDAIVKRKGIQVNDSIFPSSDISPPGNRTLYQTIFIDDFETDKGWTLTGEFERAHPQGKGGSTGNPDPTKAFSGLKVLGTDLTGLDTIYPGDYQPNLASKAYQAISPEFDLKYYKDIQLSFYKWINVDHKDKISIDICKDNIWDPRSLWENDGIMIETKWSPMIINLPESYERQSHIKFRFTLGPTDDFWQFSGWNIDDFILTGEHIINDVGIVAWNAPKDACDMSSSADVSIKVRNYADGPTKDTIPIGLSLDNGAHFFIIDTIFHSIPKDSSYNFTFRNKINFSNPDIYQIVVKTLSPGDQAPENDALSLSLYSFPVHSIPYANNFEGQKIIWKPEGNNLTWELGTPDATGLYPLPSGSNVWITYLSGAYPDHDSSWVVSPCFDFTNINKPIIEFKYWNESEKGKDGTVLQYSINSGTSWQDVPKHSYSQWKWNWYNNNYIAALEGAGWDTTTIDWFRARQFLPDDVVNKTRVRFRMKFESDSINQGSAGYKGFAFDDFSVYNAPHDVGVTSINNITSPVCQSDVPRYLNVTIKNYGVRDLVAGDTMIVGVKVNNSTAVIDTFKLTATTAIPVGQSKQIILHKPVNYTTVGINTVRAFTMIEKEPYFYSSTCNDTVPTPVSFTIYANPVIGLPKSYYTARLDTLVLKPVYSSTYDYYWEYKTTHSTDSVFAASDTGKYYITVTSTNGCVTHDSVSVHALLLDIGVDSILAPVTHCGYGLAFKPIVRISNFKTDTIAKNKIVPIKLRFNGGGIINDQVQLSKALVPDSSYIATLNTTLNLSVPGTYTLMVRTDMSPYDDSIKNDSTVTTFQIYGYPHVDLGADRKINGYTYPLDAGSGFATYLWSKNGVTTQTLLIDTIGDYSVTVTNSHGCEDRDTVHINLTVHDVGIKRIVSPVSACTLSAQTPVSCILQNFGTDTIRSTDVITMSYRVNIGNYVKETLTVTSQLLPGDSIPYTFTQKVDMSTTHTSYNFVVKDSMLHDLNMANDSIPAVIQVHGNPNIELGGPYAFNNRLEYTLRPGKGFKSYLWQDNSTDSVYVVSQTHSNRPTNNYSVTVTDNNGCQDRDTAYCFLSINDLRVDSILSPQAATCTNGSPVSVKIKLTNTGTVSINKDVTVFYQLNQNPPVSKSFTFIGDTGISRNYTFSDPVSLNQAGVNKINAYIYMSGDLRRTNDTLTQNVNASALPTIDFGTGSDTILQVNLPHTLDAGAGTGYTYNWSIGLHTQTIEVTQDSTTYSVTVTSASGCRSSKKVYILDNIYDLAVSGFALPNSACEFTKKQRVGFEIVNAGNLVLTSQPIVIKYQLNSGTEMTKSVVFTGSPASKTIYYFDDSVDLSQPGIYPFKVSLDYTQDNQLSNNSKNYSVNVIGKPVINFGTTRDTIKITSLPMMLSAGSGAGYTYLWQDGLTTQTHIVNSGYMGWYKVTVTSNLICTAKDSIYLVDATPVYKLSDQAALVIFPNPAHDILYINLSLKSNEDILLELVSSEGKTVWNRKLNSQTQYMETIDVSPLPKGLYYIRIYHKDGVVTDKVLIQ